MGFTALTSLPETGTLPTIQMNIQTEIGYCLILYNSTIDKVLFQDMGQSVPIPTSALVDSAGNSHLPAQWDSLVGGIFSAPLKVVKGSKKALRVTASEQVRLCSTRGGEKKPALWPFHIKQQNKYH